MLVNLDRQFEITEEVLFADFLRQKGTYYQAERIAKEHYAKQGYFVLYCPSLTDLMSGRLGYDKNYLGGEFHSDYKQAMEILGKKLDMLFYIDAIFRGFPDLIVFDLKKKDFFLVETKRNDTIMHNQVLFFVLARDIFNICDIKLVRVKPTESYVRKKKPMRFTLRNTIDKYISNFNKRRNYEIGLYRKIDQEMAEKLRESLKQLKSQKRSLNKEFYEERLERIEKKIEFLENVEYRETHALSEQLQLWASRNFIKMNRKYLRKLARKVLKRKSVNYEHNEFVKAKSRGRLLRQPDRSYLRINFSPT